MNTVLQNFYKIQTMSENDGVIDATILLEPSHKIYAGHFPETPVVPGVCQMQLTKELVSEILQKELRIISGQNMKFMAVINPLINPQLNVKISYKLEGQDQLKIESSISFETTTCFKFSGKYKLL